MQLAAIDIGTNSVHMIIVRVRPDLSFEVIDREKVMVRLGRDGAFDEEAGGELAPSAVQAALDTLIKFRGIARSRGVDEIIASATSAVRESSNGAQFVATITRKTGIRVKVISGTEEARLIHLAAAYATDIGSKIAVVVDIGGGSVEITAGTAARMQLGKSFKLGVLRLTEQYCADDPLSSRDERRLVKAIRRDTRGFIRQVRRRGFDKVIGTSGTALTLGTMAAGAPARGDVRNLRVSARSLRRLRKSLVGSTLAERRRLPGLDPRRADISVAGAVLLDTLIDALGADELTLCDFALREGMILDYIRKNRAHITRVERYPDVRRRSVVELAERCNCRADHAQHVARLALQLFEQTRQHHRLGAREREWLEYAALLHDAGVHISYERHHKHSYYLIKNGGLRGFEPREIDAIALIARYHRQSAPKRSHDGFRALPRKTRAAVEYLAALLRLAEGLDRSHKQAISHVRVSIPARGRHPWEVRLRSTGDAELERWAAERHAVVLSDLVGRPLAFTSVRRARR